MAHSLEVRVPFLDNDLVDFAQKVPVKFKLNNLSEVMKLDENEIAKKQRTSDGKMILRKTLSKYVPESVHKAVKQGFSGPDASWFKGESIELIKNKFFNSNAYIYKYMDKNTVQRIISEHLSGEKNRRLFIWSLLCFEEWCRIYDR
jgi:asparagine synthase (glutamine-hydrolysing)